jgi:hypothetical protein
MVSGDIMPNITCTSECNPPCKISWGEHSKGKTLSLGTVKNKDSGEYTCTASRIGGQTVQQTVSIFVTGKSYYFLQFVVVVVVTFLLIKKNLQFNTAF